MKKKRKSKKAATVRPAATSKAPRTSSQTTSGDAGGPLLIVGAAPTNDSGGGSHYGNAYRQGREALDRLSWGRDYSDWKLVAAALDAARAEAMVIAGVNQPIGRTYNEAFGEVLKREELNKLDSGTRGKLFVILKHLAEIEEWRERLEPARRMELNHPTAIVRNWGKTESGRRALQSAKKKHKKKQTVKTNLLEENVELQDRVQRLTERVTEVERERDQLKREVSRGFSEPALALKALVRSGELKVEHAGDLTRDEFIAWLNRARQFADELPVVTQWGKRRSVQ